MADLVSLDSLSGEEISDEQLHGLINQLDLDIANLLRDGKLSALNYGVGRAARGTGRWANRGEALQAMTEARQLYQGILDRRTAADEAAPAFSVSVHDDCDCPRP